MISTFVDYEAGQSNPVVATSCSITNIKKNLINGVASATINVTTNTESTSYNVDFIFNTNIKNSNNLTTSSEWSVLSAGKGLKQTDKGASLGIGKTYNGVFVWSSKELANTKLNPLANTIIIYNPNGDDSTSSSFF